MTTNRLLTRRPPPYNPFNVAALLTEEFLHFYHRIGFSARLVNNRDMSTGDNHLDQGNEKNSSSKVRSKAIVWDFFEKIKGDDGLQKTRCTNCNKV
ncbi:unnamed protein product [Lactuca virosa]|uniref:BED-type domain-containing protein n=1 Tax=Lactuca virosa TaxID=75947 RepID=A0AAU9PR93_9ASTR|nr:unnamed protein product [Lactuca virosa]